LNLLSRLQKETGKMLLVEHRLATRVPVALEGLLEIPNELAALIRMRNLSRHGAYAVSAQPVPRDRWVRVHIRVPGTRERCLVRGTVVRSDDAGVGLEFDDYGFETASMLGKLLKLGSGPVSVSRRS
jgi:hypothetical protein